MPGRKPNKMKKDHSSAGAPGGLVRLNKAVAMGHEASRRKADELIRAGRVRVNGQVVTEMGLKVDPSGDRVEVDQEVISLDRDHVYLLVNKPVRVVTTLEDPQGRTTILDLLDQKTAAEKPYPVGRLDYFSQGLLLLTTDGELCNRMTHPSTHLDKVYHITVRGKVLPEALETMARGMTLEEGERLAPVQAKVLHVRGGNTELEMVLRQGINRQIRRMCRDLGLTILVLERVRQGPLSLGELKPGKWRRLIPGEVKALRKAAGLK